MPALKLTKVLYLDHKINKKLIENVKDYEAEHLGSINVDQLLNAENAKEQIDSLKQVVKGISQILQDDKTETTKPALLLGEFLVHLFFISTTKNPARRVIISAFQSFPEHVKASVIGPRITTALKKLFQLPVSKPETLTVEECQNLRHDVDTVLALIENFPLGEQCVISCWFEALSYLSHLLQLFYRAFGPHLSPVQQNEAMHHCLETVKLANRVCQRSAVVMETRLVPGDASGGGSGEPSGGIAEDFVQTVARLVMTDIAVLQTEEFLLDCKTTSSMNICLLLKYMGVGHSILAFLAKTVFQHIDWFCKSYGKSYKNTNLPDWLTGLNLDQLPERRLSVSSYLCLCYGILTMVSMETLLQPVDDEKCVLLDVLLPEFLALTERCTDVGSKLLASKSLLVLTQRVKGHLQKTDRSSWYTATLQRFHGQSEDMTEVLEYVRKSLDDSVDAIRFTVKDLFENVISIHTIVVPTDGDTADEFLCRRTGSILTHVSWSFKGKYSMLAVLVGHIGAARLLFMDEDIPEEILEQLQEHTLSGYASDLYESLFKSHHGQLKKDGIGNDTLWYTTWVDPVITVLCGTHKLQKKHTIEYVLPKLLKMGQATLQYMITTLTARIERPTAGSDKSMQGGNTKQSQKNTENELGALVMCLRRARVMGQLRTTSDTKGRRSKVKDKQADVTPDEAVADTGVMGVDKSGDGPEKQMWCGVVNVNMLKQALICKDEQIRLDGFALLCESQKTSETVSDTELGLVQTFLPQNLNNHNPAFRQTCLAHLNKFTSRMKESSIALKRQAGKSADAVITLHKYKDFLRQLTRSLFSSLYPGCVFAKRITCLGALAIIQKTFDVDTTKQSEFDFSFDAVVKPCDITTLLECLTDTYEDNKQEAAGILISCSQAKDGIMDQPMTTDMFTLAFRLSQSTRPQDCLTAAYLFKVLLHQPSVLQVLKKHVTQLCSDTGAKAGEEATEGPVDMGPDLTALQTVTDDCLTSRKYVLVCVLLHSLQDQVLVAGTDLIMAAANRPLYPTMLCIRYCLAQVDFRHIPEASRPLWQSFFARLISLCLEISTVVSPVVQNSSPEGNVPLDEIPGQGIISDPSDESQTRSHSTVMLMPEYLIVCCWRSTKEISLIFGQMTSDLPVAMEDGQEGDNGLLTVKQVLDIGQYFTVQLLESVHRGAFELAYVLPGMDKFYFSLLPTGQVLDIGQYFTVQLLESVHRGAFELAYAGFVKLTDMLWRSSIPTLHQLPKKWLEEVMLDIKSGSPGSKLCATRRSAGVPFYIQALVSTEPTSTGRVCFKDTVQQLLALAFDETVDTTDRSSAKVHALNILRALFKDSRLKDDVAPYVADGLKVAVLGFKSALWAVRNSATLLMAAMMTRIFGVKRDKDETSFSRKNCLTGKTFFFKYPSLYEFLLDQLSEATRDVGRRLHPGLFPVLMVLGRLFPSTLEGTDTSLNLAAFIPFVIACSSSPVLKTRVMAARALQPLVEKDHVTKVFIDLLSMLPCQPVEATHQNQIHGVLLQIMMLVFIPEPAESTLSNLLKNEKIISDLWSPRQEWLISRANPCLLTRKEALQVTCRILNVFGPTESLKSVQVALESTFHLEISDEQHMLSIYQYSPALADFRATVCDLHLSYVTRVICDKKWASSGDIKRLDEIVVTFLKSDAYEVRKAVLYKLCDMCERKVVIESENVVDRSAEILTPEGDGPITENQPDLTGDQEISESGLALKGERFMIEGLQQSYRQLLTMVDEEAQTDCQMLLFWLLSIHPKTTAVPIITSDQPGDILHQSIYRLVQQIRHLSHRMENQSLSDPILAVMIDYTGSLLVALCKHLNLSKAGDHSIFEQTQSTICEFLGKVENHSRSDSLEMIPMACECVIEKTCKDLLNGDEETTVGNHAIKAAVFRTTLALLQSDDPSVRDRATNVLCKVSRNRLHVSAHPQVCIGLFLEEWVELQSSSDEAVVSLCQLMFENEEEKEVEEERLFDRGELNAYRDEVDLLQNIDIVMMKVLQKGLQCPLNNDKKSAPNQTTGKFKDFAELLKKHITSSISQDAKPVETDFAAIFESNTDYQKSVLSLYKLLLLVKYARLVGDVACVVKCDEVLEKLGHGLQGDWLPTIIKEACCQL